MKTNAPPGRASQLLAPVTVISVVLVMILPLPPMLLDLLLSIDIGLAVVLLLTSIYVKSPVDFSVFPSLLLLLTGALGASGFVANLVSSLVASATVFLVSRRLVFASAEGRVTLRLAAYLLYTLAVILIASVALQWIAGIIADEAMRRAIPLSQTWIVALAKIIITPPQLALNFLMSRYLNERVMNR